MGYQTIYKDIGLENETSWGASMAGTVSRLHIKSSTLEQKNNKGLVTSTMTSSKGHDRMVQAKNDYAGDIMGYGTPSTLHEMFEMVMGARGATSTLGTSAMIIDYVQNTSGTMVSNTIQQDRNNAQEKFSGVVAHSMEVQFSNDLIEWTANCLAKTRTTGTALPDTIGETIKPYNYGDVTVTIHAGATYGAQPVTLQVSNFSVKYDNKATNTYFSGSNDPSRVDPKIPELTGKFEIFHTGSSWVSAFLGASEFYIRAQAVSNSSEGLIAGITPYMLRIDAPRTQLTVNTRNYEQDAFSIEKIEFIGMFDFGTSTLWKVQQTVGFDV